MEIKILFFVTLVSAVKCHIDLDINNSYPALDESLYEDVLDADQCHEQIRFITSNPSLQIQFADAGIRTPRGVSMGNFVDFGNYHQCLGITHEAEDMSIQGKYCTIVVPLNQDWHFPRNTNWPGFDPTTLEVDDEVIAKAEEYYLLRSQMLASVGVFDKDLLRSMPSFPDVGISFRLAVCVPKPCTTQQAITSFIFNVSAVGFRYEDDFCRLPEDKPWSPADTVAVEAFMNYARERMGHLSDHPELLNGFGRPHRADNCKVVIFSAIGVMTMLSTTYDLIYTFVIKRDPKLSNRLYTSFSVYTNGRRLMNFNSAPGTLHCLDGIRTLAMAWVVVGHTFGTIGFLANPIESFRDWLPTFGALWITSAPITVDTFLCLAGILIVYTTVGKMNGAQLIRNLPLFYLNRLLRMFPLLAAAVLLQASYFNRMSDGPYWASVENQTNYCRNNWWATLLHVGNYIGASTMCLPHSWYIAIDVQLYIISPLVLFWVLGSSRRNAWIALVGGLLAALTAATVYNFINNFPSGTVAINRGLELNDYMLYYYFNTLTRASPFFVGMLFGYVLHVCRGKKLKMSWMLIALLWICAASISTTIFFYPYFIVQMDWDNQLVDNIMNSYMRPAWSVALCWMVIACTHGYGGPVNWFLTLDIWKLPARVSYAIFIFHYPVMFVVNGSELAPTYFSVPRFTFKFLAHMTLSVLVAYFATLLIDAPFSTLSKMVLDGNSKKTERPVRDTKKTDYQEIEAEKDIVPKDNNVNKCESDSKNGHVIIINNTDNADIKVIVEDSENNISNRIKDNENNSNVIDNGNNLNMIDNVTNNSKSDQEVVTAIDVAFDPIHINKSKDIS